MPKRPKPGGYHRARGRRASPAHASARAAAPRALPLPAGCQAPPPPRAGREAALGFGTLFVRSGSRGLAAPVLGSTFPNASPRGNIKKIRTNESLCCQMLPSTGIFAFNPLGNLAFAPPSLTSSLLNFTSCWRVPISHAPPVYPIEMILSTIFMVEIRLLMTSQPHLFLLEARTRTVGIKIWAQLLSQLRARVMLFHS